MTLLKILGSYSGYKLNLQKTQSLTFHYEPQESIYRLCTFKWKDDQIKYLLTAIYQHNYTPTTADIKADLNRWSLLHMNMYNGIDVMKMNVLPRLLDLFQSLPVDVAPKQFSEWNRMISAFIWGKQRPRTRFETLQLPKDRGGRALPCLEDYYKAAQLHFVVCWCDPIYDAKWKDIEQSQTNIPLQSILGEKSLQKKYLNKVTKWIVVPLNIWHKEFKELDFERNTQKLRWVAYDTEFTAAKFDNRFQLWTNAAMTSYCMISSNKGLDSFQRLSKTYHLENCDFFRYLQMRHHFETNW